MSKPFVNLRLHRPLAVVDVETTGISPRYDRIIEVAAIRYEPNGERLRYLRRVNPGIPIPASASAVHGITDQGVADCLPFASIAASLAGFLRDADLCGFNVKRFDLPFLLAEFGRAGMYFPLGRRAVIDVLQIYHRHEPRDLTAAVRHYLDRDHDGAHGALADAYAAAAVLDAQLDRYSELPRSVNELHVCFADVDLAQKLRRTESGRVVFTFGKYSGAPLDEVAQTDPDYLRWLLAQDFLPDFLAVIRDALYPSGSSPRRTDAESAG